LLEKAAAPVEAPNGAGRPCRDGPELGAKKRLDVELVARGLAPSRAEAAALVGAGRVLVGGAVADKTSRQVAPSEPLVVKELAPRFASRGGEKLDAAIHHFKLDVVGRYALDAGASTGGFTDCLLAHGAAHVVAVDVGHGQLLERLRRDPRVEVIERANVRYLGPPDLGGRRFDVVVADLSFISLIMVAPALLALAQPEGDLVVLVKPQFEAGRAVVSKGKGVVRDPKVWASVLCDVAGAFEAGGAAVVGGMASPLLGAEGNVEFFLHLRGGGRPGAGLVLEAAEPEPAQAGLRPGQAEPDQGPARPDLARSMDQLALSVVPRRGPGHGPGAGV
jgi:23S rRNA (cytidine1920-2'-O)/16S rRNA (cytidine1409-2'-O)-methyltransferase